MSLGQNPKQLQKLFGHPGKEGAQIKLLPEKALLKKVSAGWELVAIETVLTISQTACTTDELLHQGVSGSPGSSRRAFFLLGI